jgi:cytochrome P450
MFVEEVPRFEVPVPFVPRVTTTRVNVRGRTIDEGTSILVGLGAANRDPKRYVEPDQFDPSRIAPNFTFGIGRHRCLGSHLARLELRLVLEEWHRRIPNYSLEPDAELKVPWPAGTLALTRLPLRMGH